MITRRTPIMGNGLPSRASKTCTLSRAIAHPTFAGCTHSGAAAGAKLKIPAKRTAVRLFFLLGRKRKTQSRAGLRFRREVAAQRHRLLLARHARIVGAEGVADLVERDVGEHATIGEVFHVPAATEIERVVDRIADAIPVERLEAELVGQL